MFSSKAFRMAGLSALCLLVGVVLSGAVGAQQPLPIVTVDLIATPTTGPAPLTVVFSAMGQPPSDRACPPATYSFDFGDGTGRTSLSPIAVHTYTKPGTYRAFVIYTAHFLVRTTPPCVPRQALSRPVVIQVLQPLPPEYPCALVKIPPEMDRLLRSKIPFEPALQAARSIDDGSWLLAYDGKEFKTFINPKYLPIPTPPEMIEELERGAFIGGMKALVKFEITDRGQCFGGARSYDDGSYIIWMAHGGVILGEPPRNRLPSAGGGTVELNWFVALVRAKIPFEPDTDIGAIIFYPDDKYRSPEEMLKAARSYDDGGILIAKPPLF